MSLNVATLLSHVKHTPHMNTISITPIVYADRKRPDGTYNIKLRVTFKRTSRKIPTAIYAKPSQLTRSLNKVKDANIIAQLSRMISKMQDACADIDPFTLDKMDVDSLLAYINNKVAEQSAKYIDFIAFWYDHIHRKKKGKPLANYLSALNSFKSFLGADKCDIKDVTYLLMVKYEEWLTEHYGRTARAVSLYTSAVRYIFTQARLELNDYDKNIIRVEHNPFERYKCPKQAPSKHKNLSIQEIQQMIDVRPTLEGRMRLGVDMFLLSFALLGMNAPDMYDCKPAKDGIISYNRTKTRERRDDNAFHMVRIEDCIKGILKEYKDPSKKRLLNTYIRYSKYTELSRAVNIGLGAYKKKYGLEQLTLGSARHSWPTIARNDAKIERDTVSKCLVHIDGYRVDDVYINYDWSILWEANKKVLSLFDWHTDCK